MSKRLDSPNWHVERITPDLTQSSAVTKVVYSGRTEYQSVQLIDSGAFGRCLILDGKTQSSEADEFIYHESLVHPAMVFHTNPRRICIAGGGEGATAREVLRHQFVENVIMIDLDKEVVELCQLYLKNHHQGSFEDPRLRLHFSDAEKFLANYDAGFDVIILDLPDPTESGPAYLLYTLQFYQMLEKQLLPGGILVTQAGPTSILNYEEVFTPIHHTMAQVFPSIAAYSVFMQSFGENWGFVLAAKNSMTLNLSPARVDQALKKARVADLKFYDGVSHQSLFSLPKYIREALAREHRTITKDKPIFVY